jgi:DNA (cytosine-5)-methyltransferase 1
MRASLPTEPGPVAQAGLKYLSVCSGIEAATVAWHGLGWEPVAFSEIEKFPSAVLKHHYPSVPNWGDMTKFQEWPDASVDVLVGGTPCQSFSVAGLRKGLADPRGNLALVYLGIADRYRPEWLVWENVPGVLSSNGGRDFGAFLGGLGELGYGWSYRVLDAQFFGVAQRRRRVFVVANARGWQRAAAVLFERASLSGNPAPRREARQAAAAGVAGGACQRRWPAEVASTLNAAFGSKQGLEDQHALGGAELFVPTPVFATSGQTNAAFCADQALALNATNEPPYVAHSLRGEGFDASEDGTGRGTPLVPVVQPYTLAIRGRGETHNLEYRQDGTANALLTPNGGRGGIGVGAIAHAFDARQSDVIQYGDKTGPLDTDGHSIAVAQPIPYDLHQVTAPVNKQNRSPGDPCHTLAKENAHNAGIVQPVAFSSKDYGADAGEIAPTLRAMGHGASHANGGGQVAVAFAQNQRDEVRTMPVAGALAAEPGAKQQTYVAQPVAFQPRIARNGRGNMGDVVNALQAQSGQTGKGDAAPCVATAMQVRRLTPVECERLQGFPDGYTNIPWRGKPESPDGPRYKALGNSMAVPCMRWLGERIQQLEGK